MFCSFQHRSLMHLSLHLTTKFFMFSDPFINDTLLKFSFSKYLFIEYRNALDLSIFQPCEIYLLVIVVSFYIFLAFVCTLSCGLWIKIVFTFFSLSSLYAFIIHWLISLVHEISGKRTNVLFLTEIIQFSTIKYVVYMVFYSSGFSVDTHYYIEEIPYCLWFTESFYHNRFWAFNKYLIKIFFCIYWVNHVIFLLYFLWSVADCFYMSLICFAKN